VNDFTQDMGKLFSLKEEETKNLILLCVYLNLGKFSQKPIHGKLDDEEDIQNIAHFCCDIVIIIFGQKFDFKFENKPDLFIGFLFRLETVRLPKKPR